MSFLFKFQLTHLFKITLRNNSEWSPIIAIDIVFPLAIRFSITSNTGNFTYTKQLLSCLSDGPALFWKP